MSDSENAFSPMHRSDKLNKSNDDQGRVYKKFMTPGTGVLVIGRSHNIL